MRQGQPRIPRQRRQTTNDNIDESHHGLLKNLKKWGWFVCAVLVVGLVILSFIPY